MKNYRLSSFIVRFCLALAILAAAFSVAPAPALAAGQTHFAGEQYAPAAGIQWSARLVNRQVRITGVAFPKNRAYFVKVRPNASKAYVRIGKVTANNSGKIDAELNLPKQWANASQLTVCLKDILRNNVYCKVAKRK